MNFQNPLEAQSVDLKSLGLALLVAAILSGLVALVHRLIHRRSGSEISFTQSLMALGPIISLIMIFIGNNLALSLGMVGSLSLIRFRTAVKEMSDLIFLLWVMAIGVGCGTLNWTASAVGTLLIALLVIVLSKLKAPSKQLAGTLLVQVSDEAELKKLELSQAQQLLYLPTGLEALYKLTLDEFKPLEPKLKQLSGTWRYIANKD